MPLVTYEQTRPWATKLAAAVEMKMMPPWFADARFGHFANDPSLSAEQIATIGSLGKRRSASGESTGRASAAQSGAKAGIFRGPMWW